MRFAHLGDCHLGGWRIPELEKLNFDSFKYAINICIKEKLDFVLIAGDLFDSSYPSIDTIKEAFGEFKKLKDAGIPVFLIAGSHDYSVSGKSFLEVLEKAGFAENVYKWEERNGDIILQPTIHKNIAIYGYPGKKSGLEVRDIEKIKLQDSPGLFKILMLHTTLRDAVGALPVEAVDEKKLPIVDYIALAHLHTRYEKENRVYCGPTFPNNASELEDLKGGSFYIIDTSGKIQRKEIRLKEVLTLDIHISEAHKAHEKIKFELEKHELKGKILILKLKGLLESGRTSDIKFNDIIKITSEKEVYALLRNTTKLKSPEPDIKIELKSENIEEEIVSEYKKDNPHKLNKLIDPFFNLLQIEKKEDETSKVFENRILSDYRKVIEK